MIMSSGHDKNSERMNSQKYCCLKATCINDHTSQHANIDGGISQGFMLNWKIIDNLLKGGHLFVNETLLGYTIPMVIAKCMCNELY